MSPSSHRRRRLTSSVLGALMGVLVLAGCGTGQGSASNYGELEDPFIENCEATLAADAKNEEAAEVPDDFCRCAFDALSEGDDKVPFDDLMKLNDELRDDPAALPDSVTAAFASCTTPA